MILNPAGCNLRIVFHIGAAVDRSLLIAGAPEIKVPGRKSKIDFRPDTDSGVSTDDVDTTEFEPGTAALAAARFQHTLRVLGRCC